jgi:hypothetical protein
MKAQLFVTVFVLLTLLTACGTQTNTNNATATNTANANSQANNQAGTEKSAATPEPTAAQKQLEAYVKEFLAKPIPQKLSNNPQYKEKVAVFRKEGDTYVYLAPSSLVTAELAPYYTESSSDLRTIIVIDPAQAKAFAVDTTIPAVISLKKVSLSGSNSDQQAQYYYIVAIDKFMISISDALKKQSK